MIADINIDELKDKKGRNVLLDLGHIFDLNSEVIINRFFKVLMKRYGTEGMYPYFLNPLYRHYLKDNRFKYIIIELENDYVMVSIKYVRMFNVKYVRLIGLPISLNNIEENEDRVLNILIENKMIDEIYFRYAEAEKVVLKMKIPNQKGIKGRDYYSIVEERFKYLDRGKWRSKHRINICNKNPNIVFRKAIIQDIPKMRDLDYRWREWKKRKNESISDIKLFEGIFKSLEEDINNDKILAYNLFYKDILLGMIIFFKVLDGDYVHQVVNKTMYHTIYTDEIFKGLDDYDINFIKKILNDVGQIMFYYSLKELKNLGIKAAYCAGYYTMKSLGVYKGILNDRCIKYFRTEKLK